MQLIIFIISFEQLNFFEIKCIAISSQSSLFSASISSFTFPKTSISTSTSNQLIIFQLYLL
ncbi:MAG: hypothetical protein CL572_06510 [Alphaproteobacteria bacterium]|nr:hypothetical protein [Alphaproteobacteria bacterium]